MCALLDVVAEQITANEVRLSLLGSYASDAMRMELYLRVRAWEAAQRSRGVEVEFVDQDPTRTMPSPQ